MFENVFKLNPNEYARGLALTAFQKFFGLFFEQKPQHADEDDENLLPEFPDIWIC